MAILTFVACGSDSHRDDYEPDRGLGKNNTSVYDDESKETDAASRDDEEVVDVETDAAIPVTFSETNLVIGEIFTKDEILEYVNADSQNEVYAIKKGENALEIRAIETVDGANCPDEISVGDIYSGGMFTIEIVK